MYLICKFISITGLYLINIKNDEGEIKIFDYYSTFHFAEKPREANLHVFKRESRERYAGTRIWPWSIVRLHWLLPT